jgi:predicted outer membrane repeat protein
MGRLGLAAVSAAMRVGGLRVVVQRRRVLVVAVCGSVVVALAGAASVSAATLTVCPSGAPTCGYSNIQVAVEAASPGDTIAIAAGSYQDSPPIVISKNLTLHGAGAGQTIIEKGFPHGVSVPAASASVTIAGVTITHSGSPGTQTGCGIASAGTLTVVNSAISGNECRALIGGGIANIAHGTMTLKKTTVSGNNAFEGGAIFNEGTTTLNDSQVSGNKAFEGAGVYNEGTMTLNASKVSANTAERSGGGIYNEGTMTVNESEVSGNQANLGGGIYGEGTVTLKRTAVAQNKATKRGGGIFWTGHTLTLTQSAVAYNSAVEQGGGIFNKSEVTGSQSAVFRNTAKEGAGIFNEGGTVALTESFVQP